MPDAGDVHALAQPAAAEFGKLNSSDRWPDPDPSMPAQQSWIHYDDLTWIVVSDGTGRKFQAAWNALKSNDHRLAEFKMRALASDLKDWAVAAAGEITAPVGWTQLRVQSASSRLAASALRAGLAAAGIASGEICTLENLRRVIDHATVRDMDSRWQFVDSATWYPQCGATQRHFSLARRAAIMEDGEAASAHIRKAVGFLRLEAARAAGQARTAIDAAIPPLQDLAKDPEPGRRIMLPAASTRFLSALLALALSHRNRATESWLRGDGYRSGYDFMAAGENLAQSLGWLDPPNSLPPCTAPMEMGMLGRRLVAGDAPHRSDVLDVIQSFGLSVENLRRHAGLA